MRTKLRLTIDVDYDHEYPGDKDALINILRRVAFDVASNGGFTHDLDATVERYWSEVKELPNE